MTPLSQRIFDSYQVRRTKEQKARFIALLQEHYPQIKVELCRRMGVYCRNLILGDLDNAQAVLTAHYDTCSVLPFPNFLTPKNIWIYLGYQILILLGFYLALTLADLLLAFPLASLIERLSGSTALGDTMAEIFSLLALVTLFILVFFGRPNKHTANDNTSGVITLLELYAAMDEEQRSKVALVFFDHEESGLLGSGGFCRLHRNKMLSTPLINFDCVSDGDYLMLIEQKNFSRNYGEYLRRSFAPHPKKAVLFEDAETTTYPSDQANFKMAAAVASFNKHKWMGYYIDKIHTGKDRVFDEENIRYLTQSMLSFVDLL